MSQRPQHRPKILRGSQKRPKAKAKTDRSIKKKGGLTSILTTDDIPLMPHHNATT